MESVVNTAIEVYGAYNNNAETLCSSSSGGVVYELCKNTLKKGGVVCAAKYDYSTCLLKHNLIFDIDDLEQIKGSKYFQSDVSNIYKDIEMILKKGLQKILFIGTPCQCAGLKNYLCVKEVSIDNMAFVDIICHGVGSNEIWLNCVNLIEKKANTKITKISFKDKRRGWLLPYAVAWGQDGQEYELTDYMTLYNKNLIMRDECYHCKFANTSRSGDITVGDFWNIKNIDENFYNENGVSCVFINSEKGKCIFNQVKNCFNLISVEIFDCNQPNLQEPTKRNPNTDAFWSDYQKKGFEYVCNKYASRDTMSRIKRHFLVKLGIWKV